MITRWTKRPEPRNDYWENYIQNVPANADIVKVLEDQIFEVEDFFNALPEITLTWRYAAGKWSPKEILNHLTDTERVFSYRALRFARLDSSELPGFDETIYVDQAGADNCTIHDLLMEFTATRRSTLALLRGMEPGWMERAGIANKIETNVIRTFYVTAGHVIHHLRVIRERYVVE